MIKHNHELNSVDFGQQQVRTRRQQSMEMRKEEGRINRNLRSLSPSLPHHPLKKLRVPSPQMLTM